MIRTRKQILTYCLIATIASAGLIGCTSNATSMKEKTKQTQQVGDVVSDKQSTSNKENNTKPKQTTDDAIYKFKDSYHQSEVHEDMAYIVASKNENKPDWTDILWRVNAKGSIDKMYEGKGIDFRVNNDNSTIAIYTDKLVFVNNDGKVIKEIAKKDISSKVDESSVISLLKWANSNKYIWLTVGHTFEVDEFIKINTDTWEITRYENNLPPQKAGYTLDVDTGWVAYTNMPVLSDEDDIKKYNESNMIIKLWVYNLETKENILVNEAKLNDFNPRWARNHDLSYEIDGTLKIYKLPTK